ncbi:50S ribosomal protein L11 [endosymbiont of Pachyrhynchus infernalis]|uniref:50S ribosomal protein L11 n=1 Tax=endosymbiont of Pachyrhynchus infernalis TaxID=1971488 RepID=UPI000DC6DFB9|nr:50S ribosomal protein L11 [endosymbiont of Pachyrhynchus infernalis]BBA84823.1 50S ribosomal protein L11 [endosymbiont of Pachyrhynchus infernalis]
MKNKIDFYIKFQIPSQEASPNPSIGSVLGQRGINIIEFCKDFNDKTKNIEKGLLISVIVNIYSDKTFLLSIKSPVTSFLLKKELNINLGSKNPGKDFIGSISMDKINNISNLKFKYMNGYDIDSINKSIIGTAKSMGIKIIND